jgi:hypothetical protein
MLEMKGWPHEVVSRGGRVDGWNDERTDRARKMGERGDEEGHEASAQWERSGRRKEHARAVLTCAVGGDEGTSRGDGTYGSHRDRVGLTNTPHASAFCAQQHNSPYTSS